MQQVHTQRIRRRSQKWIGQILLQLVVLVGALITSIPLYYMVSTSFKSESEVFALPVHWLPHEFQGFSNYIEAFQVAEFGRFFLNSAVVAVVVVFTTIFFSGLAGYGLAKFPFPGNRICFLLILSTMMVPFQVILVPLFVVGHQLDWMNTYAGLIVPGAISAFGVFLMRQFCLTLPDELIDAARIDGCSEPGIFFRVALPLMQPAMATLTIITFMGSWNNLFWPMVVATRPEVMTLPVGMTFFRQPLREPYWTYIMAVSTMATLPVIAVFLPLQKYFIQGVVISGMKG